MTLGVQNILWPRIWSFIFKLEEFLFNGAKEIKQNHYFFGNKPMFIIHNSTEAIDIDTEDDFLMAENLVQVIDKKEGFS